MTPEQQLQWLQFCDVEDLGPYLGARIRSLRRVLGETQHDFAARAGIPLRTYKRLEVDGQANLTTFLRVLREFGLTKYLYLLFPNDPPSKGAHRTPRR